MHLQRRLNYTGRKKINKSDVEIRVFTEANGSGWFTASVDFSKTELPPSANVVIEARQKDMMQRFDCGTVGAFKLPGKTNLIEVDPTGPLSFWVRVLDPERSDGRLLAVARSIHPASDSKDGMGRDTLLPVRSRDLAQVPWRIDFPSDDEGMPWLVINNRIPGAIEKLQGDPLFQALVFPAAVREVISRIYLNGDGWPEDSWQRKWLDYGRRLIDEDWPKMGEVDEAPSWIENVANEFSTMFLMTERLIEQSGEGQN